MNQTIPLATGYGLNGRADRVNFQEGYSELETSRFSGGAYNWTVTKVHSKELKHKTQAGIVSVVETEMRLRKRTGLQTNIHDEDEKSHCFAVFFSVDIPSGNWSLIVILP